MSVEDELAEIVVSGSKDYKGWKCTYVGDGCIVLEQDGKKVSSHIGMFENKDHWLKPCWIECKKKIDAM